MFAYKMGMKLVDAIQSKLRQDLDALFPPEDKYTMIFRFSCIKNWYHKFTVLFPTLIVSMATNVQNHFYIKNHFFTFSTFRWNLIRRYKKTSKSHENCNYEPSEDARKEFYKNIAGAGDNIRGKANENYISCKIM